MAYDGNGTFNRLYNWQSDAANGINIMADRMDNEMDGFAAGLSLAFLRDGQVAMTGDLDAGNNRIIRVGDPTANKDAANKQYVDDNFIRNNGTAKISGTNPLLDFEETDVTADIANWEIGPVGGTFKIRPTAADGSNLSGGGAFNIDRDADGIYEMSLVPGPNWSNNAPSDNSVITRKRGDTRYLGLAGGEMTGNIRLANGVSLRGVKTDGTNGALAMVTTSDHAQFGSTAWNNVDFLASSSGRFDFFCGTTFLDATLDSNGFYLFGSLGVATTGKLVVNAAINQNNLTVSGGVELGHGGTNSYLNNNEGGQYQFRWNSTTKIRFNSDGSARFDGPVTLPADTTSGACLLFNGRSSAGLTFDGTGSLRTFTLNGDMTMIGPSSASDADLTSAVGIVTRQRGDARYARLGQNNAFTQQQTISNNAPGINLQELDVAANVAWWQMRSSDGTLIINPLDNTGANFAGSGSLRLNRSSSGITGFEFILANGVEMNLGAGASGAWNVESSIGTVNALTASRFFNCADPSGVVQFYVNQPNGNVANTNNVYAAISDERLKENIVDANPQLADVMALRVVNFNFINRGDGIKQIGLIAQEVQAVKPGLVEEDEDGMLTLKYSVLVPILLKSLQELAARVETLEAA